MPHHHRLLLPVVAALLTPLLVAPPPATGARADAEVSVTRTFSPDGDGVKDVAVVRYTLPRAGRATLEIRGQGSNRVLRRVDLGRQARGTHAWEWDGRDDQGRRVRDRDYVVSVLAQPFGSRSDRTTVDRSFTASVRNATTYGAPAGSRVRVFPRTKVVTDAVTLEATLGERFVRRAELVIRDRTGDVVWRRDVNRKDHWPKGRDVRWTARRRGEPMPAGRYTAVVRGTDRAGNSGSSKPLEIWVSRRVLRWAVQTRTFEADDHRIGQCSLSTANGCGDYPDCGTVEPSAHYVGGLSHRSAVCDGVGRQPQAVSYHLLEVPQARGVRGLAAVRVAFDGTPTHPGEDDLGRLTVHARTGAAYVESSGSGHSGWVEEPEWGNGNPDDVPPYQVDPAAYWNFHTTGTDAFDVATFTVAVRYLVVTD